jgi:hypothetical protein
VFTDGSAINKMNTNGSKALLPFKLTPHHLFYLNYSILIFPVFLKEHEKTLCFLHFLVKLDYLKDNTIFAKLT